MMDEALRGILKAAITGVPIDWGMSAQGITAPRVVLYRISGGADYTAAGPSGYRAIRVQADCYGVSVGAAKLLARQVITALSGLRSGNFLGIFLDAERDLPPETDLADLLGRVVLDFMIHYKE